MNLFFISAVLSALFFAAIQYFQPLSDRIVRYFSKPNQVGLGTLLLTGLCATICLLIPLALVIVLLSLVHPLSFYEEPAAQILFSSVTRSIAAGVAFSALLLLWIVPSVVSSDREKTEGKTQPMSLIRLFRIGKQESSTETPQPSNLSVIQWSMLIVLFLAGNYEMFKPLVNRVGSVKVPGFELSLITPIRFSNPKLPHSETTSIDGAAISAEYSPGLDFLVDLDGMVRRDMIYSRILGDNENLRDTEPIINFAKLYITPFASCQAKIRESTRSNVLLVDSLTLLEPPIEHLSNALLYKLPFDKIDDLANELSSSYMTAVVNTLHESFSNNVDLFNTSRAMHAGIDQLTEAYLAVDRIRLACSSLLNNYCRDKASMVGKDAILCSHLPESVKEQQDKYNNDATSFTTDLINLMKYDNDALSRPYIALVLASMLSIIRQNEAAVVTLDRWIQRDGDSTVGPRSGLRRARWYDLRARISLAILLEYWLHVSPVAANNKSLQDYDLRLLEEIINDLKSIPAVETAFIDLWTQENVHPKVVTQYDDYSDKCPAFSIGDDEWFRANLSYTLVTFMETYVRRVIQRPGFESSPQVGVVKAMLEELNVVNLGCVNRFVKQPAATAATIRANVFESNAWWFLAVAREAEKRQDSDEMKKALRSSLESVESGLVVLGEVENEEAASRDSSTSFEGMLTGTEVDGTYEELARLKTQIKSALDVLD